MAKQISKETAKKIALWLGLSLLVLAALIYWFLFRESWVKEPVILRILNGEVEIYTTQEGKFVKASDGARLSESTRVRTQGDSLAVLQFFEGSSSKLEGQAEVVLATSRSLNVQPLNTGKSNPLDAIATIIRTLKKRLVGSGRAVAFDVLRGDVTVAAIKDTDSRSSFEVRTLNSLGRVQGTLFEVAVNEQEGTIWEVSQGIIGVGAITTADDLNAAVVLTSLNAGYAIAISPLPQPWRQNSAILKQLRKSTENIVRKSVEEGRFNVQVKGASLIGSNPETGNVVFGIDKVVKASAAAAPTPLLPADYTPVNDVVLAEKTPGVVIYKASALKRLFVPFLPTQIVVRKGPPSFLFSINGISRPLGVAVDPVSQHVFVTESSGLNAVRCFDRDGNQLLVLVPPGTGPGERSPAYVAVDTRTGTVYVSDRTRRAIDMYDVNGRYLGIFTPQNNVGASWAPLGLAYDYFTGYLYVTEVTDAKHRVMVFDPSSGELKVEFGKEGKEAGEFSFPNGITADSKGRIYVADSNNFRIQVFDARGQLMGDVGQFGGVPIGMPRGMDIESNYLYVVDAFDQLVQVYDITSGMKSLFSFGGEGTGDGKFNFPNGLALDSRGRVYIADRENNRLQVWGY